MRYQARAQQCSISIVAGEHLRRHENAMIALRACAEGSKWSVLLARPANPGNTPVHVLDAGLPVLHRFLMAQRRIYRHRDANGTFRGLE